MVVRKKLNLEQDLDAFARGTQRIYLRVPQEVKAALPVEDTKLVTFPTRLLRCIN